MALLAVQQLHVSPILFYVWFLFVSFSKSVRVKVRKESEPGRMERKGKEETGANVFYFNNI